MGQIPDVTVCVTTYNRPAMLVNLVRSFLYQVNTTAELLICDDSSNDETAQIIEPYCKEYSSIIYQRNPVNLGFCRNFTQCLSLATGRYIVVLGDDDVLASRYSLARYSESFLMNPNVYYMYSNQVQVNGRGTPEYIYRHFLHDDVFKAGRDAFDHVWLNSIQIAGIGLRNSVALLDAIPQDVMLFPQVSIVGRLLMSHDGLGLANILIGVRAHEDQLGFHVNRGERMVGPECHQEIEIWRIANELAKLSGKQGPNLANVQVAMTRALATNLPNEKIRGSSQIVWRNVVTWVRISPMARYSVKLFVLCIVSMLFSKSSLERLKDIGKKWYRFRSRFNWERFEFIRHVFAQTDELTGMTDRVATDCKRVQKLE